jgi:hypothetical protein
MQIDATCNCMFSDAPLRHANVVLPLATCTCSVIDVLKRNNGHPHIDCGQADVPHIDWSHHQSCTPYKGKACFLHGPCCSQRQTLLDLPLLHSFGGSGRGPDLITHSHTHAYTHTHTYPHSATQTHRHTYTPSHRHILLHLRTHTHTRPPNRSHHMTIRADDTQIPLKRADMSQRLEDHRLIVIVRVERYISARCHA